VAGCPRLVKGQLLDLLSPIAEHHGNSFLTAFSIVWKERRSRASVLSSTVRKLIYLEKNYKLLFCISQYFHNNIYVTIFKFDDLSNQLAPIIYCD